MSSEVFNALRWSIKSSWINALSNNDMYTRFLFTHFFAAFEQIPAPVLIRFWLATVGCNKTPLISNKIDFYGVYCPCDSAKPVSTKEHATIRRCVDRYVHVNPD